MILNEKIFVKRMILNENFSSSQILNWNIFFWSDFEKKIFRLVKFRINFFTTRQIMNNLLKSTTCTFDIVFLQITICSYNPQNLRQLDNSIRHRSNNTFCTLFRKEFHFWFRYGNPVSSLNFTWYMQKPVSAKS